MSAPDDRAASAPPPAAGKCVIVVDEDLGAGLAANTAAVLALSVGAATPGLIGGTCRDADGAEYPGLTVLPVPVLVADGPGLAALRGRAGDEGRLVAVVTDAAQRSKTYEDYQAALSDTPTAEVRILGVALAGAPKQVNRLVGNLRLLR